MNKKKLINDPVYGLIPVRTPLIFDLIEHPLFQRLRRIKQTGLTHLVYPGAQHTRFHHALGAMHLMGMALQELKAKDIEISPAEEEAALIAVLFHDIGHSPYSHALEHLIIASDHESIGKAILSYLGTQYGASVQMALDMFTGQYERAFFHQLISGQLDLDRLDYLSRDSFYTGVAEGVVGHDRIIRMLHVVDDQLVVEEKGLYSIEKFLVARRIMYWQVYLHKTVLAAERMAQGIVNQMKRLSPSDMQKYLPSELQYFLSNQISIVDFSSGQEETMKQFQQLDDVTIDYSFKTLMHHPSTTLQFLTSRLTGRKLHKVIWSDVPFSNDRIEEIKEKCKNKYGMDDETVAKIIWTGHETNFVYKPDTDEINILTKSGAVKPYSAFLENLPQFSHQQKYYVCHPGLT